MDSAACPDSETMARYVAGELTAPARDAVAGHLHQCSRCAAAASRSGEACGADLPGAGEFDSWNAPVPPPASLAPTEFRPREDGSPRTASASGSVRRTEHSAAAEARYAIERLHAQGGLGEVYVARDRELDREVAVKRIRTTLADDESSRSRFVREARLTGTLEHPGIVPVYGLLSEPDGRPMYAMRFIRGESLRDAATEFQRRRAEGSASFERGNRDWRRLLGNFIAVCRAVAYAHSRGVVHRDLKPDNVLCGEFGETMLVDWGLAKRLGAPTGESGPSRAGPGVAEANIADSNGRDPSTTGGGAGLEETWAAGANPDEERLATSAGAVAGTPHYMSPEQAAGNSASAGPASDIYALGATLYFLLVGRPPHQGANVRALCESARTGDFPTPRQMLPDVPAPLDAICRRALALRPEQRHASAQDLAEELESWLADEPVSSYREPRRQRLVRWLRKHPRITTGAGVACVLGAAVLTASLAVYDRVNRQLVDANGKVVGANAQLKISQELAEQRAELALRSLESVVYQVQRRLRDVPGTLDARHDILVSALTGLRELRLKGGLKPRGDRSTATALMDMGDLLLQHRMQPSATGGAAGKAISPPEDQTVSSETLALEAFEQALELSRTLVEQEPDDVQVRFGLAIALEKRADAFYGLGRPEEARRGYEECLTLFRALAVNFGPEHFEFLGPVGPSMKLSGYFLQGDERRAMLEECVRISRERFAAAPADLFAERYLGIALIQLGEMASDPSAGRPLLASAEQVLRRRFQRDPMNAETRRDLTDILIRLANVDLDESREDEARVRAEEAVRLAFDLFRSDLASQWHRELLARATSLLRQLQGTTTLDDAVLLALYRDAGLADMRAGRIGPACQVFEWAEVLARRIIKERGGHDPHEWLADLLVYQGDALRMLKDGAAAEAKFAEAWRLLHDQAIDAASPRLPSRLYNAAWRLADLQAERQPWDEAQKNYTLATQIAEREFARQTDMTWRNDLLWVLERHAEAAEKHGEPALAIDRFSRAIDLLRPMTIDPASPDVPRLRHLETKLERLKAK